MTTLEPFEPVAASALDLEHESVSGDARAEGSPQTGSAELLDVSEASLGVWEMTVGGMFDTEVDEVFVVISGSARIALLDEDGNESNVIEVEPGSICRLTAGMRTRWDVSHTLRKFYVVGAPAVKA